MSAVHSTNTGPEIEVRAVVHRLGIRYRLRNRDLPGSPDLANRARKWAVFVHGCFWHVHSGCARSMMPKSNRAYWRQKFAGNRSRDARAMRSLRERGYRVLVIWQCELRRIPTVERRLLRFFGRETAVHSRTEKSAR